MGAPQRKATAAPGEVYRDPKTGRILKGSNPNPGGRPKSARARIARLTNEGEDLVDAMFRIAQDADGEGWGKRERLDAYKLLFEHYYGRPVTTQVNVEAQGEISEEALQIADQALEQIARLSVVGTTPVETPVTAQPEPAKPPEPLPPSDK